MNGHCFFRSGLNKSSIFACIRLASNVKTTNLKQICGVCCSKVNDKGTLTPVSV